MKFSPSSEVKMQKSPRGVETRLLKVNFLKSFLSLPKLSRLAVERLRTRSAHDSSVFAVYGRGLEVDVEVLVTRVLVVLGRPGHQLSVLSDAVGDVRADRHELGTRLEVLHRRDEAELVLEVQHRLEPALLLLRPLFDEEDVVRGAVVFLASPSVQTHFCLLINLGIVATRNKSSLLCNLQLYVIFEYSTFSETYFFASSQ